MLDFEKALATSEKSHAIWKLEYLELKTGKYEAAIRHNTEAIKEFPQPLYQADWYHDRALAKKHMKDTASAREDLRIEKRLRDEATNTCVPRSHYAKSSDKPI